jgi:hypothetical protein
MSSQLFLTKTIELIQSNFIRSVIAQGSHVSVAVLEKSKGESNTQAYLKDLENMRKVVLEVLYAFCDDIL